MKIFVFFLFFLLLSCRYVLESPSPVSSPHSFKKESIPTNPLSLYFIHSVSLQKESENFSSVLSEMFPKNISIYPETIPAILSPKDIRKYQELKRREADVLLYIFLDFEEKQDKEYAHSKWIYASVKLKLHDAISEKELWNAYISTEKGIIAWKGEKKARQIAIEKLAKKASQSLYKVLSSLPDVSNNKIRLRASLDTHEQLKIFQSELLRLQKAKHFSIQKNLLIVSTFLGAILESSLDIFSLKILLEQACHSAGLSVKISIARKTILVESKD